MLSNSNAVRQAGDTQSSFGRLPLKVTSEDGVEYSVDLTPTDINYVEGLYRNINLAKETLSPVGKLESEEYFVARMFSKDSVFLSIKIDGDEYGVAYVTNIIPAYSAEFNFLFWDRKTKGRQKLLLAIMQYLAEEFLIRRFELRYHSLAFYAIHRIYKIGAFYEGTKRKAWRYEDKMIDLHFFSILASELDEATVNSASIHRSPAQRKWYASLTKGRQ